MAGEVVVAKGSQTTRGSYPALCHGCQKPVRVTVDTCWYEHDHDTGLKRSWHIYPCRITAPYVVRRAA